MGRDLVTEAELETNLCAEDLKCAPEEGPNSALLRDCETSNIAKVRFQL